MREIQFLHLHDDSDGEPFVVNIDQILIVTPTYGDTSERRRATIRLRDNVIIDVRQSYELLSSTLLEYRLSVENQ